MPLWIRIVCGIAAALLASRETKEGRTVGQMKPDRLVLILILLGIAFA